MNTTVTRPLRGIAAAGGAALLMAVLPGAAQAFGERGHRITALVAERLLTPQARTGIAALMGRVDLAQAVLVLDRDKAALEQRIPGSRQWHYDNRPVCAPDAPKAAYCPNGQCASVQIARHVRLLADARSSRDDRRFAIQVLAHLAGDIHQPLHASDHDDRGGNDVQVSFLLPDGRRVVDNLHAAWDNDFVDAAFKFGDERRIAQELIGSVDAGTLIGFQRGTAETWLQESFGLATELTYGRLPGFSCRRGPDGGASAATSAAPPLRLDAGYIDRALKRMPTQLLKAGARMAFLLNGAFAAAARGSATP